MKVWKYYALNPLIKTSLTTEKYRNTKLNEIKSFFQDAFPKFSNNETLEAIEEGNFIFAFNIFLN